VATRFLLSALILLLFHSAPASAAEPASVFHRAGNWQIYGDSRNYLTLGLGAFDADEEATGAAQIELRFGRKLFFVGPAIGFLANADGGFFGYGGLYTDIAYKKLVLTLMGGAGGYEEGDGKDLGGIFQFRSEITLSYQFGNLSRLGIKYGHISNGSTHYSNPSEQDGFITFAIPF
jgi:lipid A 3-O-deacylase